METAENLCLGFGCRGKRNFAKVSGRLKIFRRPDFIWLITKQPKLLRSQARSQFQKPIQRGELGFARSKPPLRGQ